MSGLSKTVVLAESLGNALWEYTSLNKEAWGNFSASGISENKTAPFDLTYEHVFFSAKLSEEQNAKILNNLVTILKSIDATNIKANIINPSSITQQINASYTIEKISPDKVDSLSSTIASVCEELINKLASLSANTLDVSVVANPSSSDKIGYINSTIIGVCEKLIKDLNAIN